MFLLVAANAAPREELLLFLVRWVWAESCVSEGLLIWKFNQVSTPSFLCFVLCVSVWFTGIEFSSFGQQNKKRGNGTALWHTCFYIADWLPGSYQHLSFQPGTVATGAGDPSHDICSSVEYLPVGGNVWEATVLCLVSLLAVSPFNDTTLSPEIWRHFPSCLIARQRWPSISGQCCHQRALFHRHDNAMNKIFSKCEKRPKQPLWQGNQWGKGFKQLC